MSLFFSEKHAALTPYTPGEQPRGRQYIKLNTNESPFPPSPKAQAYAAEAAKELQLYSDPTCAALCAKAAQEFGIEPDEIIFTNGSDDVLNFAFMAFCDEAHGAAFPDITYGFYKVFAELNHIPYTQIPLREDFSLNAEDYVNLTGDARPLVVLSTASPYKFPAPVLSAIGGDLSGDEFDQMSRLESITGVKMPENLRGLREKQVLHETVIDKEQMKQYVEGLRFH